MVNQFSCYTASHFMHFCASNRRDQHPFDVHICNADPRTRSMDVLLKRMPSLMSPSSPIDVHQECYSDLYPHKNLLYLTPYSPNILEKYNPNDIYVIGAVIDYGYHGPITLNNAKKLGIRTASLPIHRYMNWGGREKNLPINIMGDIIRDFKNTRDWDVALKHVPIRLRKQPRQERHLLHRIIQKAADSNSGMPHITWNEVRDQTRAIDDATANGLPNPFKNKIINQAASSEVHNPFQ